MGSFDTILLPTFVLINGSALNNNMDLNNIRLSADMISDLYKDHLVQLVVDDAPQIGSNTHLPSTIDYEDNKKIAAIVNYPGMEQIPATSLSLLRNLFTASGISMDEIAIINKANAITVNEMISKSKVVFLFGVEPKELNLPISFPQFQVQPFNGAMYLFSPSLDELENDKLLKSKLWVCLKRIFNIA